MPPASQTLPLSGMFWKNSIMSCRRLDCSWLLRCPLSAGCLDAADGLPAAASCPCSPSGDSRSWPLVLPCRAARWLGRTPATPAAASCLPRTRRSMSAASPGASVTPGTNCIAVWRLIRRFCVACRTIMKRDLRVEVGGGVHVDDVLVPALELTGLEALHASSCWRLPMA